MLTVVAASGWVSCWDYLATERGKQLASEVKPKQIKICHKKIKEEEACVNVV